jgi:hypothetical protein
VGLAAAATSGSPFSSPGVNFHYSANKRKFRSEEFQSEHGIFTAPSSLQLLSNTQANGLVPFSSIYMALAYHNAPLSVSFFSTNARITTP